MSSTGPPRLIVRGVHALERIATVLERIALDACQIDLTAAEQAAASTPQELERFDGLSEVEEELAAAIEELEEQGIIVPAESYRKLGLEVPRRESEPTAEELAADQPAPDDPPEPPEPDEPIVARRRV